MNLIGYFPTNIYFKNKIKVYDYPRPVTNSLEHQARVAERMIAEGQGKIYGISSKWDYEKGQWK